MEIDRRRFLGAAAGGAAFSASLRAAAAPGFDAPFRPVLASREREIRTVAGLRPYRRSGFVIRAEKAGRRTLVHNYGHGGCGVTMSWGCAKLALAAAGDFGDERAAVVGAGVIGLTTAVLLARRGVETTVYAAELPPHTTSNIAAALWEPTTLFRLDAVDEPFLQKFRFAARASQNEFQHYANNPRYGVRWIRKLNLSEAPPAGIREPHFEGDDLYPGLAFEAAPERYFGFAYAERHYAMVIDPDIYLPALIADFERAGGRIVERRFETAGEILDLKEKLIFNCTGYGAKALFGDAELTPVKGQLTMLLPQPEIDYGYIHYGGPAGLLYMFPRQSAIVLGGTHDYGEASLDLRDEDRMRMIAGHAEIAARAAEQIR